MQKEMCYPVLPLKVMAAQLVLKLLAILLLARFYQQTPMVLAKAAILFLTAVGEQLISLVEFWTPTLTAAMAAILPSKLLAISTQVLPIRAHLVAVKVGILLLSAAAAISILLGGI